MRAFSGSPHSQQKQQWQGRRWTARCSRTQAHTPKHQAKSRGQAHKGVGQISGRGWRGWGRQRPLHTAPVLLPGSPCTERPEAEHTILRAAVPTESLPLRPRRRSPRLRAQGPELGPNHTSQVTGRKSRVTNRSAASGSSTPGRRQHGAVEGALPTPPALPAPPGPPLRPLLGPRCEYCFRVEAVS